MKEIQLIVTIRAKDNDDRIWEQSGKAVFTPPAPMDEIVPNTEAAVDMAGEVTARLWRMFMDCDSRVQ